MPKTDLNPTDFRLRSVINFGRKTSLTLSYSRSDGQCQARGDRWPAILVAAGAARQGIRPGGTRATLQQRPRAAGRRRRRALATHRSQLRGLKNHLTFLQNTTV